MWSKFTAFLLKSIPTSDLVPSRNLENDGIAGSNYGWPLTEGPTDDPRFRSPFFSYRHNTRRCAISGGAFYTPTTNQFPVSFRGKYFFADLCAGWIRVLNTINRGTTRFASGISQPVDLRVGLDGSLYYLARGEGGVLRRVNRTPGGTSQTELSNSDE